MRGNGHRCCRAWQRYREGGGNIVRFRVNTSMGVVGGVDSKGLDEGMKLVNNVRHNDSAPRDQAYVRMVANRTERR